MGFFVAAFAMAAFSSSEAPNRGAQALTNAVCLREANWYARRRVGASKAIQISANRGKCRCQCTDCSRSEYPQPVLRGGIAYGPKLTSSTPGNASAGSGRSQGGLPAAITTAYRLKEHWLTLTELVFYCTHLLELLDDIVHDCGHSGAVAQNFTQPLREGLRRSSVTS